MNQEKKLVNEDLERNNTPATVYTISTFKEKLIQDYKTKRNGEFFKDQDIYQYIYRGQIPKTYGGQQIQLRSEGGLIQFSLLGSEESYLERRGRPKGSRDSIKRGKKKKPETK